LNALARFYPLIDGNKRSAWTLTVLVHWINGYRHDFSTDEGFNLVVSVASGSAGLKDCATQFWVSTLPALLPITSKDTGCRNRLLTRCPCHPRLRTSPIALQLSGNSRNLMGTPAV
jgi:hypothetical protein